MTVFNRRDATLRCLRSLEEQVGSAFDTEVFVVDDGSTDGTSAAIMNDFPEVTVIDGTGDLYWNGGMRLALDAAYEKGGFDYYCWLNDDIELDDDAIVRLVDCAQEVATTSGRPGIVVGSLRDPVDGHVTYGGVDRPFPSRPMAFWLVQPQERVIRVETMNGNIVLVPAEIAKAVGNLNPAFTHKMGDYDYGLEAANKGYSVFVAPGTHGTCARNPERETAVEPLGAEVRRLWSVKELPFWAWATFNRRWGGPLWPLYFVSPYIKGTTRLVAQRLKR